MTARRPDDRGHDQVWESARREAADIVLRIGAPNSSAAPGEVSRALYGLRYLRHEERAVTGALSLVPFGGRLQLLGGARLEGELHPMR